jgi:hypothetical protein
MGKTFKDRRKWEKKREDRDDPVKEDKKYHRKRYHEAVDAEPDDDPYSEYNEYA